MSACGSFNLNTSQRNDNPLQLYQAKDILGSLKSLDIQIKLAIFKS